jgi:5-hydroxyisourate hydrolase
VSQITTHILDTARGIPAAGIAVVLSRWGSEGWEELAAGTTSEDGRIADLLTPGETLAAGTYRLHFATGNYFAGQDLPEFYPYVDVVFELGGEGADHHIPLLLSPFGYSTYRGS